MLSEYYELEKIAFTSPTILGRVSNLIKSKLPTWRKTKQYLIGDPRRFAHEIRTGKALEQGGMLREGFKEGFKSPLAFGLMYGMPAYQTYQIATDPTEKHKGARIGGLLGGTTLGMGLWRPAGLIGSSIAGSLGESAGSALGSLGEKL